MAEHKTGGTGGREDEGEIGRNWESERDRERG